MLGLSYSGQPWDVDMESLLSLMYWDPLENCIPLEASVLSAEKRRIIAALSWVLCPYLERDHHMLSSPTVYHPSSYIDPLKISMNPVAEGNFLTICVQAAIFQLSL